jgi:hypothetical protein
MTVTLHSYRPPPVLDVEASGDGARAYPIEIGVALSSGHRYRTLIAPAPCWTGWDASAAIAHGISRAQLDDRGRAPYEVARLLNDLLCGITVYSDDWMAHSRWLGELYAATATTPSFTLRAVSEILSQSQRAVWHATRLQVRAALALQRRCAPSDAQVVQETWYRTRLATAA